MRRLFFIIFFLITNAGALENIQINGIGEAGVSSAVKLECLNCHAELTPDVVDHWKESKHGLVNVKCYVCHGSHEKGFVSDDFVSNPKKERCRACHAEQVTTLSEGKMGPFPCGSCHMVHQFSEKIAGKTCTNCHKIQSEMFNGSIMEKNGVTCSNCHFHEEYLDVSNHNLRIDEQSCGQCHEDSWFEKVTKIQEEINDLLLATAKDPDEIELIENDGSMGFHNPEKAKKLLGITDAPETPAVGILMALFIVIMSASIIQREKRRRD